MKTKTALGLKKHKPCKRCEGMPAGRDGYCKECRKELATIGASVIGRSEKVKQIDEKPEMDKNERRKPDMKKKFFDIDSVMICGKEVMRDGKEISGPLSLLFRVTAGGWAEKVTTRKDLYGKRHFETKFRTIADAKRAFAKLAALPAAKSLRDYTTLKYCIIGPKRERMNQNGGISRNF